MLAFSTKNALALTCPTTISTSIPSVCQITIPGESVTVTGSGSVEGIQVNKVSADSITNAGSISSSPSGTGISVGPTGATLSGGISNSGSISGTNNGIVVSGTSAGVVGIINDSGGSIVGTADAGIIVSSGATVSGISNSGSISGANEGIEVTGAGTSVDGIINNNGGTITATHGAGIAAITGATISGGISNAGSISVTSGSGIVVNGATISGGISNSGSITATATSAINAGISVFNSGTISGGISNSGSISGTTYGIFISGAGSSVDGIINNSGGLITGTGNDGILVNDGATLSSGISNAGSITSTGDVGITINDAVVSGEISNSGSISGSQGILLIGAGTRVDDSIINSSGGVIRGTAGAGISISSSATLSGAISNSGIISGTTYAVGVFGAGTSVDGGIINNSGGSISATSGIGVQVSSSATLSGGISNSGSISGISQGIFVSGVGTNVHDIINNSGGLITATTDAGIAVDGATLSGGISNSGSIVGGSLGVSVFGAANVSDIINNSGGSINATGVSGSGISVYSGATLSGRISNAGSISATSGAGIAVLSGATVSKGISNSGSINGGHQGILVSGAGTSVDDITNNSGGFIAGSGTGISILSGATLSGGISNAGFIESKGAAIFVDDSSTVSNIDIIGTAAHIHGSVQAQNTAVNIMSGAQFVSDGTFNVASFTIQSDALFQMANAITLTAGPLTNDGTLFIANGSSQSLTGNYVQSAGGLFEIGAQSTTSYGQLTATTVNLSDSGAFNVQIQAGSTFHPLDVLSDVLLTTPGNFTGPADYTVTDNSFLWEFTGLTNGGNDGVDLTISLNSGASSACAGTYCAGAANVIIAQVAAGNPDFSSFSTLPTEASFVAAASQSTPELINENFQVTQLVTRSVLDVLPMWSAYRGSSTGDAMLYQPGKVWVKPYASNATQSERNTVQGYNATAYGLVAGLDTQILNDWMLGGALAIGDSRLKGSSVLNAESIDSTEYQGVLYATKTLPKQFYLAAQALLGFASNDSKRTIFGSTAEGNYNSWFSNLSAELGWSYAVSPRLVFTPSLNASYLYINQNGFTENGSPLDLQVQSNNNDAFLLGADASVAYHVATLKNREDLSLTAHAGVAEDILNNQPSTTATFLAGGPSFSTYGIQYNEPVFRGGVGVDMTSPISPFAANLNYDLQAGNNSYNGIFSITISYKL